MCSSDLQKVSSVGINLGGEGFEVANFGHLSTHCRYALIMPQWDFLNFMAEEGKKYPGFDLRMEHEAVGVLDDGRRTTGVRVQTNQGAIEIGADLVVACDGRHSTVRKARPVAMTEFGVPIDVLWFRLTRREDAAEQVLGYVNYGKLIVLINRNDYYQAAFIIRKGSFGDIQKQGLEAFRNSITQIVPFLQDSVEELKDWDQVKLLSVQINRLKRWYRPGLLFIGDSAHAMSPVFGVGINLAIQDAVATANILNGALRTGSSTNELLPLVQRDRELRTRVTQRLQAIAHGNFKYIFRNPGPLRVAPWVKLILRSHLLQPALLRVVGAGIVPEHIGIPGVRKAKAASLARRVGVAVGATVGAAAVA